MLRLPNAKERAESVSSATQQHQQGSKQLLGRKQGHVRAYGLGGISCHSLSPFFFLLLTCPCCSHHRQICHSPSLCREVSGVVALRRQRGVSFSVCWVAEGKGSRCALVHTVLAPGSYSHSVACLWFCSCFSLECFCGLCFYSLAGFGAQAVGALRWTGWTPLRKILGCSEFGVNIQSPGGVVLILKSGFAGKSSSC